MNFNEELKQRVEQINALLAAKLPAEEGMQQRVAEAMNYSVNAGGKRLRPMLLLEVYRLLGGTDEKITEPFMAALECIHTYSLVHDDLPAMDNDDYRRGKLTTHKKFGEDFGVLAGDGLLNYAYELLFNGISEVTEPDDLIRCVKAAKVIAYKAGIYGMIGGQTVDVELTNQPIPKDKLDFIYRLKTGALLEASMVIGAVMAGASEAECRTVERMAAAIGLAFQIQDDILDVTSSQEVLGKPVLSDEKNNKTTYVTLEGIEKSKHDVKQLSETAVDILYSLPGKNEFLEELIEMLVSREK